MAKKTTANKLADAEKQHLLATLQSRFQKHMTRHQNTQWAKVNTMLEANEGKLWSIYEMERTGGEPDVVEFDNDGKEIAFCDCSPESPAARRSLCYDEAALEERKENKPAGSAVGLATAMGIELLTADEYRQLQELGKFDLKTSSWLKTPPEIRALGGSIFGDRRYNTVFTYHNGAQSYYAARGFRGLLRL